VDSYGKVSVNDCWSKYVFSLWQKSVREADDCISKRQAVPEDGYSNWKWTPADGS